nr:class F sortase [Micromonospora sp. DSM 115978]
MRITIADIGVSAPVVPLDLDADQKLEAPTGFDETGWNQAGPEPGEPGAAVVAGHVDSHSGPAVFYRLGELQPGAVVAVERADGTNATFRVDRLAVYPKDDFPSEEVYIGNGRPELRLITCGGEFDSGRRSYVDNVVVFAS